MLMSSPSYLVELIFERGIRFTHAILCCNDPVIRTFSVDEQLSSVDSFLGIIMGLSRFDILGADTFTFFRKLAIEELQWLLQKVSSPSQIGISSDSPLPTGLRDNIDFQQLAVSAVRLLLTFVKFTELSLGRLEAQLLLPSFLQVSLCASPIAPQIYCSYSDYCLNHGISFASEHELSKLLQRGGVRLLL